MLLLSVVAACVGGVAITGFQRYNDLVGRIDHASSRATIGERVNGLIYAVVMDSRGIYMSRSVQESEKYAPLVLLNLQKIERLMVQWTALIEPEDKATMDRANDRVDEFIRFRTELVRLSREATLPEARAWGDNDANRTNRTALNNEIATLAVSNDQTIAQLKAQIESFYRNRLWLLIGLGSAGILVSFGLAIGLVVRTLTQPIKRLTQTMITLAGGSTDVVVPEVKRGDEIGEMARAVVVFLDQAVAVRGLTTQIIENIRRVAVAATQASDAVGQVSDGSNVQLNALKHAATALEQSTHAIADVAHSTQLATDRARQAAGLVENGIRQMGSMVELVGAISESSAQISRIADAISRIANQTNMLSLNAAIEAARAGEHGRGFAVVAEEVRKLAESSRGLAQDIAELVRQATAQADQGVSMAQEVSGRMHEIAGGVSESDRLIGAIATAMEEQRATVAGISENVGQLTRIGQSNATAAEEISVTMRELSDLADRTRVEVKQFAKAGRAGTQSAPGRAAS
ncbi:MAG TPA: methyl-accepting chemotaxis protein [Stellaceae bacterium]